MSGFDDYAKDIADAMYRDMDRVLNTWLGKHAQFYDLMLDDLVAAAMYHVETMLVTKACDEQRQAMDR
jgi:hypothetical protein